ncbi:MAG: galactose-1-phosphate uridylyltransferase [Nitrospinota bacterium]|nr:galactose-1-phosphate uridylyltransferase [Nitrospinota bacterium]
MRELRKDPVLNRWVIISSERASRPMDTFHVAPDKPDTYCPFCEGQEAATPPELFAIRQPGASPNGPGWSLRVVPNKFPALTIASPELADASSLQLADGSFDTGSDDLQSGGLYQRLDGVGYHEVIIETPHHSGRLSDMNKARAADIYHALKARLLDIKKDPAMACAQYFKNHGRESGASLAHSHSQLIAMPVVSRTLGEELAGAANHRIKTGECVYCRILRMEGDSGERLIAAREGVAALAPYASRFPYEAMIMPMRHASGFEDSSPEQIEAFSSLLVDLLAALADMFDNPPYNLVLHTAPFAPGHEDAFHWHMEIIPVMARAAGFEWGSGFHINSVPPEIAAARMRKAMENE